MRINVADLVSAMKGNGDAFEAFVHDLIRSVCRFNGIDPTNALHWDYRTNVRDGGRDLVLDVASTSAAERFLPSKQSVWSFKSGEDGVSVSALRKEIRKHPKVQEALKAGRTYVWCTVQPATIDKHTKMREAADDAADGLGVPHDLIEFRWSEDLFDKVNLHPGLIPIHFPGVAAMLKDVLTFRQWRRAQGMSEPWVDFGDRSDFVKMVTQHLLGRELPNVLHVGGLSGVGKTRTILEAIQRKDELQAVFYVQRYDLLTTDLYRYLEDEKRYVYLVIDETPLEEVTTIASRLREFAERVRVVTLGPVKRQAPVSRDEIRIMAEPERDGVLSVVRAAGPSLSETVQRSIALQSAHDLRLAHLLVEASDKLEEFRGVPIVDVDGVWARLMVLFASEIGDRDTFRPLYEVLTPTLDVGMEGEYATEIVALSDHFQHRVEHVRDDAQKAFRCGLGIRTPHFFECSPRALATRLFAERVWPRIRDRLEPFFLALPERLQRRFVQRCHDCTGEVREEVMARLGEFFPRLLANGDITELASREASRVFQTWAEFDPVRGLAWLRRAVEGTRSAQLRAIDGEPDGSGGWRGRRQLVWTCHNLASFPEHFRNCEAILYRLALHETEPRIGNNSTVIWQSLFWPALGSTSVPFSERLPLLLGRLRNASDDSLTNVLGAAIGCVERRFAGLPLPPSVVGGRVVPPPLYPRTNAELQGMRREAGEKILDAIEALPEELRSRAMEAVMGHLAEFAGLGLLQPFRSLLRSERLDDSLRRRLRGLLENHVAYLKHVNGKNGSNGNSGPLHEWLAEVSPADLASRARDLTAQEPWSVWTPDERVAQYDRIADELIANPETLAGLTDWFGSASARSAGLLAERIGSRDAEGRLAPLLTQWLRADRARGLTIGYLLGVAARERGLPDAWAALLDDLGGTNPDLVAEATALADVSGRGASRLLDVVARLPARASRFLRPLALGGWLEALAPTQRVAVLTLLDGIAQKGDVEADPIGLALMQTWSHSNPGVVDDQTTAIGLRLARRMASSGREMAAWLRVLELMCLYDTLAVADLAVDLLTRPSGIGWADQGGLTLLERAAKVDPAKVMEAIGTAIVDPERRAVFGIDVFRGLFEAIGLEVVRAWLDRNGLDHLPWLARHFPSPYLENGGNAVVPPLTQWLFRDREADQRAFDWFLMGRHSSAFTAADIDPNKRRQDMGPFLRHDLRRVREWAEYEIADADHHAAWFRQRDEEDERR